MNIHEDDYVPSPSQSVQWLCICCTIPGPICLIVTLTPRPWQVLQGCTAPALPPRLWGTKGNQCLCYKIDKNGICSFQSGFVTKLTKIGFVLFQSGHTVKQLLMPNPTLNVIHNKSKILKWMQIQYESYLSWDKNIMHKTTLLWWPYGSDVSLYLLPLLLLSYTEICYISYSSI